MGAPRRVADVLYHYWTVALEPYWSGIRSVLEDDVAFRAGELTRGGMAAMVAGIDHSLTCAMTTSSRRRPARTRTSQAGS